MPLRVRAVLLTVVIVTVIVPLGRAQQGGVAFEVVSIKPNTTGSMGGRCCWEPGGLYTGVNMTAAGLIRGGYATKVREFIGAPDWLERDRFDVTARAGFEPTPEEQRRLVQAFLADRFKLAAHYQSQERPVYGLVLARADGTLGPQLRKIDVDCATYKRGESPLTRSSAGAPPCSFRMNAGGDNKVAIVSGGRTMDELGDTLSGLVGRPVIDRTNLTGYYEFSMEYPADETGGPLFTALREQLGLKLESSRAPLDVLVIDHIERPTQD